MWSWVWGREWRSWEEGEGIVRDSSMRGLQILVTETYRMQERRDK
jgi:hypothetical protein